MSEGVLGKSTQSYAAVGVAKENPLRQPTVSGMVKAVGHHATFGHGHPCRAFVA